MTNDSGSPVPSKDIGSPVPSNETSTPTPPNVSGSPAPSTDTNTPITSNVSGSSAPNETSTPTPSDDTKPPIPSKAIIIDDNEAFREIYSAILHSMGYEPFLAEGGNEALKVLSEQIFDIAFLDMQMPGGKSGIEVLKELREDRRHDAMHVIVITANPHMAGDDAERLADFILMKPFDVLELSMLVQRLVNKPRVAQRV